MASAHAWLKERGLLDSWPAWRVIWAHEHGITLDAGGCLAVIGTRHDGPAALRVMGSLPCAVPGEAAARTLRLDLEMTQLWEPPRFDVDVMALDRDCVEALRVAVVSSGKSALLMPEYCQVLERTMECLQDSFPRVTPGASLIAGLGPGLTPSGDDFIAGYCHVLSHAGWSPHCDELVRFTGSTTRISREMIWWASRGVTAQPFEEALVSVIEGRHVPAISDALSVGHSSGADHLLGVWFGLSTLLLHYRERAKW
ncbi:MAG: DUF2877 domain-containing protein [Bacillota bacterium]